MKKAQWWDFERRNQQVLLDPNNEYIPRVPDAGKIINGCQIMHNGLKVLPGTYGNYTRVLEVNRGVHEPQEERVFMEVLKDIPDGGIIVEFGSYWSFYAMWFYKEVKRARCYMIEPNHERLIAGKENFALNNMQGDFTCAMVGGKEGICVDTFIREKAIDFIHILHADIQGAELEMLQGAKSSICGERIKYFFISTHSQKLHYDCMHFLQSHSYIIIASADSDRETYCFDGVLVARLAKMPGIDCVEIALADWSSPTYLDRMLAKIQAIIRQK